jgi:hypothetical protein
MTPVRYTYFTWRPPKLSESEQIELGKYISVVGRERFVEEFRERLEKPRGPVRPRTGIAAWPKEVRCILFVVLFGGPVI